MRLMFLKHKTDCYVKTEFLAETSTRSRETENGHLVRGMVVGKIRTDAKHV